ncbi:lipase 1-like [Amyelois transitella]|uniref:lipase 1-like n=1 Tax=Amyelois transitella TaxID=680683 RepID=UPI00299014C5|nr:lipase 1-like [Amyelois transitella]
MLLTILAVILYSAPVALSLDNKEVPEDGRLNFTGLALKYAGAVQEYDVTTEDGYVLKIYRIPGDNTKPLLLMHGILATSDDFIISGNDSLAVSLKNEGYDIWFGNYRGNRYSRRHMTLDPDANSTFWYFGPHEHGYHDLATSIDFVLNRTGVKQLSLIGYSEGTMIAYILAAERPEYNDKIKVFIAMAPICHVDKMIERHPVLVEIGFIFIKLFKHFKVEEIAGFDSITGAMTRSFCGHNAIGIKVCRQILFLVSGNDPEGLIPEFMSTLFWHYPVGTSRTNLEHFLQIMASKRFAKFDYGPVENLRRYKSKLPPEYDLSKVTMSKYLIAARNDRLSALGDSGRQAKELPNVMEYTFVDSDSFNHIDFLWSRQSRQYVHPKVLKILKEYNS